MTNFLTRFLVTASFVILALVLPPGRLTPAAVVWGMALLGTLTYFVAQARGAAPVPEVVKHIGVPVVVIVVSRAIGTWILARVSG